MDEVGSKQHELIDHLEKELQNQKGMLWVLGEIMKIANNIDSFKMLMDAVTDMLMGIMGVNTCYIWVEEQIEYKIYLRSTELSNVFIEETVTSIPDQLKQVNQTLLVEDEEITFSLREGQVIPRSRLIVPFMNFDDNTLIGGMVLEQNYKGFFTIQNTVFFETLATFISCNTRNSKMYEQVTQQSERDPLTGVYNRRYLDKLLDQYIERNERFSVAIIDTDNFKQVNDLLGHMMGDEVLKDIAKEAKVTFEPHGGKVIRYGGDEFVIIVPQCNEEVLGLFEKFQQSIPMLPVVNKIDIPVTITMGVYNDSHIIRDKDKLLQIVDNALLRGKACGKNKVILAKEKA